MRRASRAIIVNNNQILLTKRNKFGDEYYILIGGGVDMGESEEEALLRELHEESGVEIKNPRKVFTENAGDMYGVQNIYLCEYVGGEAVLRPDSTEAKINAMDVGNTYETVWLPLSDLPTVPFRSDRLRRAVLDGLQNGFPDTPLDITDKYR